MNETRSAAAQPHGGSLYGQDLLAFIGGYAQHCHSAHSAALHVLTHAGRFPTEEALKALGMADRAAFEVLSRHPHLPLLADTAGAQSDGTLFALYANSLGRLHIRPHSAANPVYDENDSYLEIGHAWLPAAAVAEVEALQRQYLEREAVAFATVMDAMREVEERGELAAVLESVIDHVEHVESVCFYIGDRFFARIDRFVNLIDTKAGPGHLPRLHGKPLARWEADDVLLVAALHALFLSGRAVRFEEFNGIAFTADGLVRKIRDLYTSYAAVGCMSCEQEPGLFELARFVGRQTRQAVGQSWLRYRRIYGLNFQKNEFVAADTRSSEDPLVYLQDFGEDYARLVSPRGGHRVPECLFFNQLAGACLAQDIAGVPMPAITGSAAAGWVEALMEKIVASAVKATGSDYGMSSSIRDIGHLMKSEDATLVDSIHELTPAHFFTCFVSRGFASGMGPAEARVIASSVQRRMMFNRWHFIPGNLERSLVLPNRHWYYPPLLPDIATHSDVHRAAHARARVKYSIRAPGPDMSRPPLTILNQTYRGFYDIRVIRMNGPEYEFEQLLRARRRTLWLEAVYTVLTSYLQDSAQNRFKVSGFEPGAYLDLSACGDLPRWPVPDEYLQSSAQPTFAPA
ncbi:hypothetical protein [Cystobacter fuscus]|uniref:hypothetical protein n=1 Tax=Cystobacter fuscus TaxID=43 RepID=UPI002B2AE69D|nr:hypothetical protein F0U63_11380 [Cystobacter fuscus]